MGDPARGLYDKFRVVRTDGQSAPGGKHDGCRYFVLDLDHDPHAEAALRAYGWSCKNDLPALSDDIALLILHMVNKRLTEQQVAVDPSISVIRQLTWEELEGDLDMQDDHGGHHGQA